MNVKTKSLIYLRKNNSGIVIEKQVSNFLRSPELRTLFLFYLRSIIPFMSSNEHQSIDTLLPALFDAATNEDWDNVDYKLIPQLKNLDQNLAARALLKRASDDNPNIRDLVATGLEVLSITDQATKEAVIVAMVHMATTDNEVIPAGRGAAFLITNQQDEIYGAQMVEALERFKQRARLNGWVDEFTDNIPKLQNTF